MTGVDWPRLNKLAVAGKMKNSLTPMEREYRDNNMRIRPYRITIHPTWRRVEMPKPKKVRPLANELKYSQLAVRRARQKRRAERRNERRHAARDAFVAKRLMFFKALDEALGKEFGDVR